MCVLVGIKPTRVSANELLKSSTLLETLSKTTPATIPVRFTDGTAPPSLVCSSGLSFIGLCRAATQDDVTTVVAELIRTSDYDFAAPLSSAQPFAEALRAVAVWCKLVLDFATSPVSV